MISSSNSNVRHCLSLVTVFFILAASVPRMTRFLLGIHDTLPLVFSVITAASVACAGLSIAYMFSSLMFIMSFSFHDKQIRFFGILLIDSYLLLGILLLFYGALFSGKLTLSVGYAVVALLVIGVGIWLMFDRTVSLFRKDNVL